MRARETSHFGIYGVLLQQGRLVTVRKSRGPYEGLLDLPGGTPEAGESPWQTLRRELIEEVGARLISAQEWRTFALHVVRSSRGVPINGWHRGRVARVRATGRADVTWVEDVVGVELIEPHRLPLGACSAPLAWALRTHLVRGA
ncbi:NUDIX domain-containing protein [Amnibacterium endophyticum]|uniref:NUDIX domain-containing protein n=1 Tax=Amnibacterium endophyticum TaxID=2109337 RepID=A0ABW4LL66_9MICO